MSPLGVFLCQVRHPKALRDSFVCGPVLPIADTIVMFCQSRNAFVHHDGHPHAFCAPRWSPVCLHQYMTFYDSRGRDRIAWRLACMIAALPLPLTR